MRIHDKGHKYQLTMYNGSHMSGDEDQILTFMKREGNGYPGNEGHYAGTNIQEVLRALIDRLKYLNNQIPHDANTYAIADLRHALWELEKRAAERHKRKFDYSWYEIETHPTCSICGHIGCNGNHK